MPFVVVCGIPSAGKTTVATALVNHLRRQVPEQDVVYISLADINVGKTWGYVDSKSEKSTRSALKAAVEKVVNTKTIVVLDALNYTKGERYELFCKAKEESTTYCVVYVDTPVQLALKRNAAAEISFDSKLLQELAARFEVPVEKNRWDSPLFRLTPNDFTADGNGIPLDTITEAIRFGKTVKAGLATKAAPVVETNFLQALDETTNAIVEIVLARQQDAGVADGVRLPLHSVKQELRLTRSLSMAEACRYRRQFIKITRSRPCAIDAIGDFFIDYLNQQT
ncbi:RNA polymerase II elongator associated protein [Plasmopara halstedii]|uniref:RNA polymerase II elongator associated protein n=1 Tax=Plasmopara halstedii TaxID=4781 RepID=A0A0P1AIK0_PLAHL|nr:RNA polymerase II elongator associated protein [Plasmopara halstedii]CEG40330.1 RNA polymerase II elongator associated protein [Plasmopara halstedii]|eukprot:XP_024576699.1 RNA polymerase II elongator associated protein [Plasmopara halstedii]